MATPNFANPEYLNEYYVVEKYNPQIKALLVEKLSEKGVSVDEDTDFVQDRNYPEILRLLITEIVDDVEIVMNLDLVSGYYEGASFRLSIKNIELDAWVDKENNKAVYVSANDVDSFQKDYEDELLFIGIDSNKAFDQSEELSRLIQDRISDIISKVEQVLDEISDLNLCSLGSFSNGETVYTSCNENY